MLFISSNTITIIFAFLIVIIYGLVIFALLNYIQYGLLVGFLAGIVGWIFGPEGGFLMFSKWGFAIGMIYAIIKDRDITFKLILGFLAGFIVYLILYWIFNFNPIVDSGVMFLCVLVGGCLTSREFAWEIWRGIDWLLTPPGSESSGGSSSTSSGGSSGGGSSGGGGSSSSTSCIEEYPGSKGVNPYEQHNPKRGQICGNCKYWSGGTCELHGYPDYIAYNLHACWKFEQ